LSCPDGDEIDSDSTEETIKRTICNEIILPGNKKRLTKKFMEEEKDVPVARNYSREYETILKKESIKCSFDKFDLYFNEPQEEDGTKRMSKLSITPKKPLTEGFSNTSQKNFGSIREEEDYLQLKSMSMVADEPIVRKDRANSIFKLLEFNIEEKRRISLIES
jgi:hypothetical protein